MSIEVKVPQLPESVAEATIGAWHKKAGDKVGRDENLVDLETDKAGVELPAPESGVLVKIVKQDGEAAEVGDVIGELRRFTLERLRTGNIPAAEWYYGIMEEIYTLLTGLSYSHVSSELRKKMDTGRVLLERTLGELVNVKHMSSLEGSTRYLSKSRSPAAWSSTSSMKKLPVLLRDGWLKIQ